MAHVFISYAREDQDFAEVVQAKLEKAGHETSLDVDILRAGDDWGDKLDLAIRDAHALVLVMTPDARRSEYCTYEWAFAIGARVRLIALDLVATEHHPRLNVLQRLDFTNKARPWEALLSEVAKAEAARAQELDTVGGAQSAVKQAICALDSLDQAQRQAAVNTLANAAGEAARQALGHALHHPLRDVRIQAARLYADRKDPRIVRGLVEGVEENWNSRSVYLLQHAVESMGTAAVPELLALLAERAVGRSDIRPKLVDALGVPCDSRATPALLSALRDDDPSVRASAAAALSRTGGDGAVAALREALADPVDGVRKEAATALGQLGDLVSVSALGEILGKDVASVRLAAVRALGQLRDAATAPALREALRDANLDVQVAAADALGQLGDPAGAAHLQSLLTAGGDSIHERDVIVMRALVQLGVAGMFPRIEERLIAFRSGNTPTQVVEAFAARGSSGIPTLVRILAAGPSAALVPSVALALSKSDAPEAREAFRQWRLKQ